MRFIEEASFSVAEVYLGFFVVSFVILSLIVLSGFPPMIRKLVHAVRLTRARRQRGARMLADREKLDRAGENLVGLMLFDSGAERREDQEDEDARAGISDAA